MLKTHNFVYKELQETFQNERTIERATFRKLSAYFVNRSIVSKVTNPELM